MTARAVVEKISLLVLARSNGAGTERVAVAQVRLDGRLCYFECLALVANRNLLLSIAITVLIARTNTRRFGHDNDPANNR